MLLLFVKMELNCNVTNAFLLLSLVRMDLRLDFKLPFYLKPKSRHCIAIQRSCRENIHLNTGKEKKKTNNRQYSYSPTVLGRVCLHHECGAHAGNFSPREKTNMRKLLLSLPNLRKIFNTVKFRRAYILERSLFQKQKEDLLIITKKNSDPNHNYIDEKSAW